MEVIIKEFRVKLDAIHKTVLSLGKSRELAIAATGLQNGKMWLGELLKSIEATSPYQNEGKRQHISDIEPEADTSSQLLDMGYRNPIGKLDLIREELRNFITLFREKIEYAPFSERPKALMEEWNEDMFLMSHKMAVVHITEAKNWLGQELGRIRDHKK